MLILHDVIKNNFDWRDNPLLIWMPGSLRERICQFVGYVKGAARACTLLAVCKLCIDAKVDLLLVHPALADSMKKVPSRMYYVGAGD